MIKKIEKNKYVLIKQIRFYMSLALYPSVTDQSNDIHAF